MAVRLYIEVAFVDVGGGLSVDFGDERVADCASLARLHGERLSDWLPAELVLGVKVQVRARKDCEHHAVGDDFSAEGVRGNRFGVRRVDVGDRAEKGKACRRVLHEARDFEGQAASQNENALRFGDLCKVRTKVGGDFFL